jgi:hypothetical protein
MAMGQRRQHAKQASMWVANAGVLQIKWALGKGVLPRVAVAVIVRYGR